MRWIVEVGSLEKSETQSYCVEAESWQGALQAARRLRGDESRMAGFSIDITNDGCKAVDPAKKIRYEVKRTGDDTPLTPPPTTITSPILFFASRARSRAICSFSMLYVLIIYPVILSSRAERPCDLRCRQGKWKSRYRCRVISRRANRASK